MKLLSLTCLIGLVLAAPAAKDSLQLQTGQADGVVYTITMKVDGKSVTYNRTQFTDFTMGEKADDSLKLKDGTVVKGTLDSLRISTLGGLLTYKRTQFTGITISPTALDNTHKDYLARRYAVDEASPEDLFKLAQWCKENKLKNEAFELARMSLKIDMNSSVAEDAHAMLGEVWDGREWVLKSELPAVSPGTTKPGETATEPGGAEKTPPLDDQARKETLALYQKLCDEYKGKAKDANDREFKAFSDKYKPLFDGARGKAEAARKTLTDLDARIKDLRDNQIPKEKDGNKVATLRTQLTDAQNQRPVRYQEFQKVRADLDNVAADAKNARRYVNDRASRRNDKFDVVRLRIPRLIGEGKALTETDMRTMFESALSVQ